MRYGVCVRRVKEGKNQRISVPFSLSVFVPVCKTAWAQCEEGAKLLVRVEWRKERASVRLSHSVCFLYLCA